jgi:serine/threonine protein kinase
MVLYFAREGNYNSWLNKNIKFDWKYSIGIIANIISGLKKIHEKKMVHRDFHIGNILVNYNNLSPTNNLISISDMGLCGEISNTDKKNIYGVMPYIAPEVLRGRTYTEAADIYSFGMIMYFVATGRQPFSDCAHDEILALEICGGNRPEIIELEAPKCYIDLMKRCWDSNPDNRPDAIEIEKIIELFNISYQSDEKLEKNQQNYEIEKQFEEAEEYRELHLSYFEKNKQMTTHPQAIYTSRLLNPFTKDLYLLSECVGCKIDD